MIFDRSGVTLRQTAGPILSQSPSDGAPGSGELGFPILTALILGGVTLLGGGTLWQFQKKRDKRTDYLECLQTYTNPPYSMPPQEAALVCGGDVQAGGFKFGLNAPSFILIAASVFGMWFVTDLLITAAKGKIGGKN